MGEPGASSASSASSERSARGPRVRWLRRGAVLLLVLVALEAALQLTAFLAWRNQWVRPGVPQAGVTLCVGDGVTWGLAAPGRDAAYPAALQRLLREGGGDRGARVVNGGWPARTSADVLRRLPEQLAVERPSRVLVLVGDEDLRRGSDPVDLATLPARTGPLPWRWRTVDLVATLWAAIPEDADRFDPPTHDAPPFVGAWHVGSTGFTFEADGELQMAGQPVRWSLVDDGRIALDVAPGVRFEVDWEIRGGHLWLTGGLPGGEVRLARGTPLPDPAARARQAIALGQLAEARWLLVVERNGARPSPRGLAALAELLVLEGATARAREVVAELARMHVSAPGPLSERMLALARLWVGDATAGLELVLPRLDEHLRDDRFVRALATCRLPAAARDALRDALQRGGATGPGQLLAGWLWSDDDPAAALDHTLRALAEDPSIVDELLPPALGVADQEGIEAALARVAVPPDAARPVRERLRTHRAQRDARARTLEHELAAIVGVCRAYGAEPWLLTTPLSTPRAAAAVRRVAGASGARLLSVDGGALTREHVRRVAPTALTADGYAALARAVSEGLQR